jgi:hypothetical protein
MQKNAQMNPLDLLTADAKIPNYCIFSHLLSKALKLLSFLKTSHLFAPG